MATATNLTALELDDDEMALLDTVFQLATANLGEEEPELRARIEKLRADLETEST